MKRTVSVFVILLLWTPLFSQVTIRERVQLSPQARQPRSPTQSATTLRLDCSFSGPVDNNRPRLIYINGPCGNSAGLLSVNGSISVQAYGGGYTFGYRFNVPQTGGSGLFQFALYLGNDPIYQVSFPISCPAGCGLMTHQPLWLYSGFTLSGNNDIWYGDANRFGASSFSSPTPCLTSVWHPEVPITLEITSGSEFGSFVDNSGNDLGKKVTKKASEFNTFSYLANGDPPQGSEGTVVITATSANITVEKSFKVKRRVPDHFAITLEHDEIAFTETSKIFVQAKDVNDQDVVFDDNELLFFTVVENGQYGTFINKNGDTVKTEPPTLGDISYADAKSGQIRFAAVKKNPAVREVAKIRVAWQGDETKKGEKKIAVLEQTLKIVMIGPREVRPLIPEEIIKLPGGQGSIIPFRAMTELRVSLTYKGSQVAGHQFELSSNYVDGSGGHDHVTDRRTRNLDNYGSFSLKSNIPSRANNPYQGKTTLGDEGNVVYTASVFGDRMLFKVQSTHNSLLWDTVGILEKVELLEDFAEAPPAGYWNLTGNTGHTTYSKCLNSLIEHSRNHYGSQLLVEELQNTVLDFFDWSATEEGGGSPLKLGINDMSLEQGGLFDICGDWLPGHWYHRTGASVDIDGDAEQYDSPGDYVRLQAYQVKKLTSIMESRKGKRYPEASIHYGFGGH